MTRTINTTHHGAELLHNDGAYKTIRKYRLFTQLIRIALSTFFCLGVIIILSSINTASASANWSMPLNGLQKSSGHSGFIPNREISESENKYAHLSQDYVTSTGDWNVMSIYNGVVLYTRNTLTDGAGRYVIIKHTIGSATVYSIYQHLSSISVSNGQSVTAGQVIGVAGQSGTSETSYDRHLHLAIYTGVQKAWAPRLTQYALNVEYDGPISYSGTTYYNPSRVLNGTCVIEGTETVFDTSTICYEKSTYKVIKGCNLKDKPNASADNTGSVSVGDTITINALVKNSNNNGNMWLQTTDGKYLFSGLKLNESTGKYEVDNSQNQHVSHLEDKADISISGQDFPSGVLTLPITNYALKGNISNSSNTITSISGGIYYAGTNTVAFNLYKEQTINGRNFSLAGSAIDNALTFRSITEAGNYEFRLTVYYYTNRMQKTSFKVFKSSFTVSSSGTSTPTGDVYKVLSTTTQGLNVRDSAGLSGNVIGRLDPNQTITVTKTATADGYTWGYGSMSNGLTGWVVISRTDWIQKISSSSIAVTGVIMYPEDADKCEIYIGQTTTASATIFPNNATNKALTWTSSNPNVLAITRTYDQYAELVGKSKGQAVITCTTADGGFKASGTITVLKEATGITLTPTSLTLDVGDTYTMKPTVLPTDASNQTVHWFTSDNTIVRIQDESKNLIKALKPGTVTITAMSESRGHTAECTVTVGYELDVNGRLDGGKVLGTCNDLGTFDVYINGSLSSESKSDHVSHGLSNGTTYEIKNVKAKSGYRYKGLASDVSHGGGLSGTITNGNAYIVLDFVTTYPVTYNANGGTGEPRADAKDKGDATFKISSVRPTRDGYTFLGWATSSTATTAQYQPGDSYTQDASLTLYAVWKLDVIYVSQIKLSDAALTLEIGDTHTLSAAILPSDAANPTVTWSTDNSDVATVNNGTVTAVGRGTANVTCTANDGSGVYAVCAITVNELHTHSPIMIRPTLATRAENGLSIGFRCACGEVTQTQKIIESDGILSLPAALKRIDAEAFAGANMQQIIIHDGMTEIGARAFANCRKLLVVSMPNSVGSIADDAFDGCDTQYLCIVANDDSYAAQYADNHGLNHCSPIVKCNVIFDANGGECDTEMLSVEVGNALGSLPIPTKEGCIFSGWYKASGEPVDADTVIQESADLLLRAKWSCAITFNANGGFCANGSKTIYCGDAIGTLPTPTRTYYTFNGWYTASSGGTKVSESTTFAAATTLYAQWTRNTCTITFNANGGSCSTGSKKINCGDAIGTLPTPTRTYYTFNGWYTASSGGTKVSESTTFATAVTLYAQWTRNTCTITFNANGGSCSTGSKKINCGDTIGTLPTPTRTYYTFNGWYTATSGGTKINTSTTFASSTTVYAQWSSKGYGSWSDWSTSAVSSSSTRQVETKVERVQTGTKTTYSYDRYLYYHPGNGYNMSSYASNWATSQGYSGSWQYLTLDYALTAAGSTDGVAKYSGYYRDGNQYWWHQTVNTEAVYTDVTYYRYRDLIQ